MPRRRQTSVVCGIRGCRRHFGDRQTLEQHLSYEHPMMVFRGTNGAATPCPWKNCSDGFHTSGAFRAHFLAAHIEPLNIRARPTPRRVPRTHRVEQCEICHHAFPTRFEVLLHHLRAVSHHGFIPHDQDESWPDVMWIPPDEARDRTNPPN
ncbi:unnamed protein product [Caenorhabditis angaria]|uniref:C2H2-type domain-containing protein n=1 Tax=Caenorhabditis angaria TaxID=860376 RepID=A0A9P1N0M1_9PELO|nr:unnamed protein product [Caenorhabditis angaria]